MTPEEILALRKRLGLTQAELARRFKVDVSAISRLERGSRKPSLSMMRKLRRAEKRMPKEAQ